MPAGPVTEGVDDVDLVVVEGDELLALHQASFPIIFAANYVDLSIE